MRRKVMLLVTRNCNLDCFYCYEHHKDHTDMDFFTTKEIIDRALYRREDQIEFEFFGGEPFLNFSLIKETVQYIKETYPERDVKFSASTNGTLVHGKIQKFLLENRDIFLPGLSLDGTELMHDLNRPFKSSDKKGKRIGSFSSIDLDFFLNNYENPTAKMTISPFTLPLLSEGIIYLHELGFYPDASFAAGIDWNNHLNLIILEGELQRLIDYYTEHSELTPATFLRYDYHALLDTRRLHHFCGAGVGIQAFDTDGKNYPCQGFSPVSVGADAVQFENASFDGVCYREGDLCRACRFCNLCPSCFACNYMSTGSLTKQASDTCFLNRAGFLAGSRIEYQRLKDATDNSYERQIRLKAALIIQENAFSQDQPFLSSLSFYANGGTP